MEATSEDLEQGIARLLYGPMTDGFNRSMNAHRDAGATKTRKMDGQYCGVGSKYYDMVTEQMQLTVECAKPAIRRLLESHELPSDSASEEEPRQDPSR
jgi:hypothetical protein